MKKIKIGILTFSRAHNYGSILQAYALEKYIMENFNCQCEIIDFSNKAQIEMYNVFKRNNSCKNILKNCIAILGYKALKREYDDFEGFINKYLILSNKKYYSSQELKLIQKEYNILITGSDQIWNIMCPDADDAYFLDFIKDRNIKKIAYAPSFGARNLLECANNPNKYKKLIEDYDYVSIREKNGKKWIKNLTGQNVPLLIDPTLFYEKEKWKNIMSEKVIEGNYILYYAFVFNKETIKVVKSISRKYKMPVVILSSYAYIYKFCWAYGFKLSKHSSPAEFLRLINDATLVLSTSFHGTLFSALFEKNFWFLYGSIQNENDDRALTLVEQLGIEDRVVRLCDLEKTDLNIVPKYGQVRKKTDELRVKAFEFLDEALGLENKKENGEASDKNE